MRETPFVISLHTTLKTLPLSKKKLEKMTAQMLRQLGWKRGAVNIMLVGDGKMRRMNREYLGHDTTTDVISFSQIEGKKLKQPITFLGDIVISVPTAKRQAKEYGNSAAYELCFYICHGLLHLMGYDDKTEAERKRMDRKQTQILKKIGIR